ncbi:MAG TPA: 2-C-methyl-D-erythritol 4-phosphate cytidylyltransferase [Clostridia bacterium]|nr:2-C-methyl-D-erythritol 4-phosphate cytidylyltransferase [Clostridia bacterium]
MKTYAVLLAAGCGNRFGSKENKVFQMIGDHTMLERAAACLLDHREIAGLIVVAQKSEHKRIEGMMAKTFSKHPIRVVTGGESRQASALAGLVAAADLSGLTLPTKRVAVLIHDAARCFLPQSIISDLIDTIRKEQCGVAPVIAVTDTVRLLDESCSAILKTLPRNRLVAMQTPQGADLDVLLAAARQAQEKNIDVTDDLELLIRVGYPVKLIKGNLCNIKITTPDDVLFAGYVTG